MTTLDKVTEDLSERLIALFMPGDDGSRPCFGGAKRYRDQKDWQGLLLFHEYFHAESGEGLGASHQTGWTSLIVRLVRERIKRKLGKGPKH